MSLSFSHKIKNKFLKKIHTDKTTIIHQMCGPDACFEELFGSLCGHIKPHNKTDIPTLIKKLKENNLFFSSKKAGVDYIKSGVRIGIHKKGFTYFFTCSDEDEDIFVVGVTFRSDGFLGVDGFELWYNYEWSVSYGYRIVVPAKTLEHKS